jgi:hypothetical protein
MQSGPAVRGKGVSLNQDSVKSDDPFYTGDSNVEIIEATIFAKIVNYLVWASLFVGVAGILRSGYYEVF